VQCVPPSSLRRSAPSTTAKRLWETPAKRIDETRHVGKAACAQVAPRSGLFQRPKGEVPEPLPPAAPAPAQRTSGCAGSGVTAWKSEAKMPRKKGVHTAPKLAVFQTVRPKRLPSTATKATPGRTGSSARSKTPLTVPLRGTALKEVQWKPAAGVRQSAAHKLEGW